MPTLLDTEVVLLYKVDPLTQELYLYETEREEAELSSVARYELGYGIVGFSAATRDMINLRDPQTYPKYSADIDNPFTDAVPHSMISIPISTSNSKVIGVLIGVNKRSKVPEKPGFFDEEDEYLFRTLGNTVGTIINNAKVFETMSNGKKKVAVLLETTRSLASILDLDRLIKVIMDSAKELLTSDRCTLFLHDPDRKQLRAIIQGRDSVQEIRIPSNAGIAGAVFTSGGISVPLFRSYQYPRCISGSTI